MIHPMYYQPSDPGNDEPGVVLGVPSHPRRKLRESKICVSPSDEPSFNDTHRLREASFPSAGQKDSPNYTRGVPTNHASSSTNYKPDHVKLIHGEHVSLVKNGVMNEAMEDDDHQRHILEHRMMLGNPELTETQRSNLLKHIESHVKTNKRRIKAAKEALEAHGKRGRFDLKGKAHPPKLKVDGKIPQPTMVDKERQRTAGILSMESRGFARKDRLNRSLRVRRGL